VNSDDDRVEIISVRAAFEIGLISGDGRLMLHQVATEIQIELFALGRVLPRVNSLVKTSAP
jgi:hypothetical protein